MTKARSLSDFIESDGSVTLVDNQKIKIGTGNDLEIYHDGTNSIIADVGTGNIEILGNNLRLKNADASNSYLNGDNGGGVTLYHAGNQKFITTSTGVSVTGEVTSYKSSGNVVNTIESGSSGVAGLKIQTSAGATNIYAGVGSVQGLMFYADGTNEAMRITSTNRVGINENDPQKELDVAGTIRATGADNSNSMEVFGATTTNQSYGLLVDAGTSASDYAARFRKSDNSIILEVNGDGNVGIGTDTPAYTLTVKKDVDDYIAKLENDGNSTSSNGLWVDTRWNTSTNNVFKVTTNSGTQDIITAKGNGNVGIGDTSPDNKLTIRAESTIGTVNGHIMLTGDSATNGQGPQIVFSESGASSNFAGAYIGHARTGGNSVGDLIFGTRATSGDANTVPTERMRLQSSGKLLINALTSFAGEALQVTGLPSGSSDYAIIVRGGGSSTNHALRIVHATAGNVVGSITFSNSSTTYNTTSDIRLKTDIEPITDSTEKLMSMNPVEHKWKADQDADSVHGFIAQEMEKIVPEAVSGDPEGEEMMSMDYGRITPIIVGALQDAHNKIIELENKLKELGDK